MKRCNKSLKDLNDDLKHKKYHSQYRLHLYSNSTLNLNLLCDIEVWLTGYTVRINKSTDKLYCLLLPRLIGETKFCLKQIRRAMKKLSCMYVDRTKCYQNGETCFRMGKQIFKTTPI